MGFGRLSCSSRFPRCQGLQHVVVRDGDPFGRGAQACLEGARVAVVPGMAFGAEGHVRLSYAASMDNIREGLKRIAALVEG